MGHSVSTRPNNSSGDESAAGREFCSAESYEDDAARFADTEPRKGHEGAETPASTWRPPQVHSYGAGFDAANIPPRQWLLGRRRSRGEVTVDIGPPGVNKSTLLLADAVAIVIGRAILADEPYVSGEVLIFAGEDSRRDVEAKLAGILQHYNIPAAALGGRLHIVYLSEVDPLTYTLAKMVESIAVMNRELLDWVQKFPRLVANFIDPVAAWHLILENDNGAMKVLCTELRRTAVVANIHLGFDHHITKATMGDPEGHVGNLAAARGAYIVSDARWVFSLAKLRPSTARDYGIESHEISRWRRLDSLKTSYGADDVQTRLLEVKSVTIANGEQVAVLTEGDTRGVRAAAVEREATADAARREALTKALTAMLLESCPRSAEAAACWLQAAHPTLFPGRGGDPLSTKTIRERLPHRIGRGLDTYHNGGAARIVCLQSGTGKGLRREITWATPSDFNTGNTGVG
jgi:hypothetical protein